MKSFGIAVLVVLVAVCFHTPQVESSNLLVRRKGSDNNASKIDQPFNVFCAATGGKALTNKQPTCKKEGNGKGKSHLVCQRKIDSTSTKPSASKTRGELTCSSKGKLEVNFKDCDKNGKKATNIFCEFNPVPVACKAGPSATPVSKPPLVTCITKDKTPTESSAVCIPSKTGETGKFTGVLRCKKTETMTFSGTNGDSKNPCSAPVGQGTMFCTPPASTTEKSTAKKN